MPKDIQEEEQGDMRRDTEGHTKKGSHEEKCEETRLEKCCGGDVEGDFVGDTAGDALMQDGVPWWRRYGF